MKIINKDFFEKDNKLSLNKKESKKHANKKILAIVLSFGMGLTSGLSIATLNDNFPLIPENDIYTEDDNRLSVSLDEINSLNIIINDNNCSNNFFNEVCNKLNEDGIKFTAVEGNEKINEEADIVITLDQQYMAGPDTVVFAPYSNNQKNNSDVLTLALNTSFDEYGFFMAPIACGVSGYRETEYGVSEKIPTSTEENVHKNTSYATISFGSLNVSSDLTVSGIEGGLVRYCSYMKREFNDCDLIYRIEHGESLDDVKEKLNIQNIKTNNVVLENQTIINPVVKDIPEFDKHTPFNLYVEKTLWSK